MSMFCSLFSPVKARHIKHTVLLSPDDEHSSPSRELVDMALRAARAAMDADLTDICNRLETPALWPKYWPGEHYRLLAGLVQVLQPRRVVEIGTHTGWGTLALKKFLPADSTLSTFDLVAWDSFEDTVLCPGDFDDGRLRQTLADLADPAIFGTHRPMIQDADLIVLDGPKDKRFEPSFMELLATASFKRTPWLVVDSIKDWNMLKAWQDIDRPKMDLTSLGHWTGTGLVRWIAAPLSR